MLRRFGRITQDATPQHNATDVNKSLLLARLMGEYCFARWRLSSVVVCNAAGGRADGPPGAWAVHRRRVGRVGGLVADTVRRASTVTSR